MPLNSLKMAVSPQNPEFVSVTDSPTPPYFLGVTIIGRDQTGMQQHRVDCNS
jgi:hypothetical protein